MFVMSQAYDRARTAGRYLNWPELISHMSFIGPALFLFFLGFAYLARLTFYIK
jgi:hypothetical protein